MKELKECKNYFKDLYMNCMQENAFEKDEFESTELARFNTFCNTMDFIYGEEFYTARLQWTKEASKEFFSKMN